MEITDTEFKKLQEFIRLFKKATGKTLTDDEASWHMNRLVLLYRTLLYPKPKSMSEKTIDEGSDGH